MSEAVQGWWTREKKKEKEPESSQTRWGSVEIVEEVANELEGVGARASTSG